MSDQATKRGATKWGIVATAKAPAEQIEAFAAYHVAQGAARVYIYLDDENEAAYQSLKAHPKLRVFKADEANWRSANRPEKHQVRQAANARHCYRRKARDVDWLAHIDVDEFLISHNGLETVSDALSALPPSALTARVRPIEALAEDAASPLPEGQTAFKAMTNDRKQRQRETETIYPTFGAHLNGGFLSHVAGKVFVRTGLEDVTIKIHNAFIDGAENPGQVELEALELAHLHAQSYEHWMQSYRYRLAKGAYRAELKPNKSPELGGLTLHELLKTIEESDGEDGLKAFYQEVCTATPALLQRLEDHGLLRRYSLGLNAARMAQFG